MQLVVASLGLSDDPVEQLTFNSPDRVWMRREGTPQEVVP
jgi:hypothetical protein